SGHICTAQHVSTITVPASAAPEDTVSPGTACDVLLLGRELPVLEDPVDQTVFDGLLRREDLVPIGVLADLLGILAGVLRERVLHEGTHALDLGGLDLEVGDLTLDATRRGLVDEHA